MNQLAQQQVLLSHFSTLLFVKVFALCFRYLISSPYIFHAFKTQSCGSLGCAGDYTANCSQTGAEGMLVTGASQCTPTNMRFEHI